MRQPRYLLVTAVWWTGVLFALPRIMYANRGCGLSAPRGDACFAREDTVFWIALAAAVVGYAALMWLSRWLWRRKAGAMSPPPLAGDRPRSSVFDYVRYVLISVGYWLVALYLVSVTALMVGDCGLGAPGYAEHCFAVSHRLVAVGLSASVAGYLVLLRRFRPLPSGTNPYLQPR